MRSNVLRAAVGFLFVGIGLWPAVAPAPAAADSSTLLPLPTFSDILVDPVHSHVFVSGGAGTSDIVVLDFDGAIVATIADEQGASGMALRGSDLWVGLHDADAIARIDTGSLAEVQRFDSLPSAPCPVDISETGGSLLWFAYDCTYGFDGGVGSLDLQTGTIRTFQNVPNYEPVVAGSPASSRLLLAADAGLEPMTLYAYDISSGTPVVVGVDDDIQNGYLGHVVMTPDGHDVLLTESGHSWVQDLSVPTLDVRGTYDDTGYQAITPDGRFLATAGNGAAHVGVFRSGQQTAIHLYFGWQWSLLHGAAFEPDGSNLFLIMGDEPRFSLYVMRDPISGPAQVVRANDDYFVPAVGKARQDGTAQWEFPGHHLHTVTDSSGMGLFDSGSVDPGYEYRFTFLSAGTYPYRCRLHQSMTGTIEVPIKVVPSTGGIETTFTATWGAGPTPHGFVYDAMIRRPNSNRWARWKTGQTDPSADFVPDRGVGMYLFRARIRRVGNGASSDWSPADSILVS